MREFIVCWTILLGVLLAGVIYLRLIEGSYDWILVVLSVIMIAVDFVTSYINNNKQ